MSRGRPPLMGERRSAEMIRQRDQSAGIAKGADRCVMCSHDRTEAAGELGADLGERACEMPSSSAEYEADAAVVTRQKQKYYSASYPPRAHLLSSRRSGDEYANDVIDRRRRRSLQRSR